MAVAKMFRTEKGTELPLLNLRGKPYLMVAHRFVWLTEMYDNYTIDTEFLVLNDDYSICKAVIKIFDKDGNLIKSASSTKREDRKDFSDFTEKSETSACGRALAMLGCGTQFCTQDMEEGTRLADSPITPTKKPTSTFAKKKPKEEIKESEVVSTFAKKTPKEEVKESEAVSSGDGWS